MHINIFIKYIKADRLCSSRLTREQRSPCSSAHVYPQRRLRSLESETNERPSFKLRLHVERTRRKSIPITFCIYGLRCNAKRSTKTAAAPTSTRSLSLCLYISLSLCLCFFISLSVRPWICLPAGAFASLCVVPSMLTLDYVRKWNGFGELATALVQPSLRAQSIGCNFSQYPTASPNRPAKPRNILSKPINICSNFCHN